MQLLLKTEGKKEEDSKKEENKKEWRLKMIIFDKLFEYNYIWMNADLSLFLII